MNNNYLKAFGDVYYSYGHKGSVNTIMQSAKKDAPEYPKSGEIDIMPYYPFSPPLSIYDRYVASEKDILGLIWLTKIDVR